MSDPIRTESRTEPSTGTTDARDIGPTDLQIFYSRLLGSCALVALVVMLVTYAIYSGELVPSKVPPGRVSDHWGDAPAAYAEAACLQCGWGWITRLGNGECLSRLGPALLGLVTIVCLSVALPIFLKKRDWVFAAIIAAEVAVLVLSASGLIGGGH
jgi:hypothetical protein